MLTVTVLLCYLVNFPKVKGGKVYIYFSIQTCVEARCLTLLMEALKHKRLEIINITKYP